MISKVEFLKVIDRCVEERRDLEVMFLGLVTRKINVVEFRFSDLFYLRTTIQEFYDDALNSSILSAIDYRIL